MWLKQTKINFMGYAALYEFTKTDYHNLMSVTVCFAECCGLTVKFGFKDNLAASEGYEYIKVKNNQLARYCLLTNESIFVSCKNDKTILFSIAELVEVIDAGISEIKLDINNLFSQKIQSPIEYISSWIMIGCCNNDHITNSSKDIVYRNIQYQSGTSEIIIKYDDDQLKKMVFTFTSKELFENITKRLLRCNWNTQPIYHFDSLSIEFTINGDTHQLYLVPCLVDIDTRDILDICKKIIDFDFLYRIKILENKHQHGCSWIKSENNDEESWPSKQYYFLKYLNRSAFTTIKELIVFHTSTNKFFIKLVSHNKYSITNVTKFFDDVGINYIAVIDNIYIEVNHKEHLNKILLEIGNCEKTDEKMLDEINEFYDDKNRGVFYDLSARKDISGKTDSNFYEQSIKNPNELIAGVEVSDCDTVQKLLSRGHNPNSVTSAGIPAVILAFMLYLDAVKKRMDWDNRKLRERIIEVLLYYGADINANHPVYKKNIFDLALNSLSENIVELILSYRKDMNFKLNHQAVRNNSNNQTLDVLKRNYYRTLLVNTRTITAIPAQCHFFKAMKNKGSILDTFFVINNGKIVVKLFRTTHLSNDTIKKLADIYVSTFKTKLNEDIEKEKNHFHEKLCLYDPEKEVFIDIIKVNKNIVGFNLFENYKDSYTNVQFQLTYCSLAYMDKRYRGTRVMSLLSFRPAHALKFSNPNIETYVFFDAIHANSYRQIAQLPYYPKYRTEQSLAFVKYVLKLIYGKLRANQFDGFKTFYLKTDSIVEDGFIPYDTYDLPHIFDNFNDITKGKGGVPVLFPVTSRTLGFFKTATSEKLNGVNFEDHVKEYTKSTYGVVDETIKDDSASCLWQECAQEITKRVM